MQDKLRPCEYRCCGIRGVGLFHCFEVIQHDINSYQKKGETFALVENDRGKLLRVYPNDIRFLDTEKQMKKFFIKKRG